MNETLHEYGDSSKRRHSAGSFELGFKTIVNTELEPYKHEHANSNLRCWDVVARNSDAYSMSRIC